MHREYLLQFIEVINKLEFYKKGRSAVIEDYEVALQELVDFISEVKHARKQIFFIGNGGSAAIASHMTADFLKNGDIKTCNLYDNSVLTCLGNDFGYEDIFSKQLNLLVNNGDLLVAISSSGNSENIVNAIKTAQKKQAKILTFSGFERDNQIIMLGDYNVYVPITHYGIVESAHNLLLQQIVDTIRERSSK